MVVHAAHLAVDGERGVVLRTESRPDGELFRFVSPDGSPVRLPRESFAPAPRHDVMSVGEAARRASFTVLVPERVPQGWSLDVASSAATDRPRVAESVTLNLRERKDFAPRLSIHESADPIRDQLDWEEVERKGRPLVVLDDDAPGAVATVKAEIDGTHVRATGNVDRESPLAIVASLRPAPAELPPFTSS